MLRKKAFLGGMLCCLLFWAHTTAKAQYVRPGWFVQERSDEEWEEFSAQAEKQAAENGEFGERSVMDEDDVTGSLEEVKDTGKDVFAVEKQNFGEALQDTGERVRENADLKMAHERDSGGQETKVSVVEREAEEEGLRFAINNQDLRLASVWLDREMRVSDGENFAVSPLSFYSVSVLLANGLVDESLGEFSRMFPIRRLSDVTRKLKSYMDAKKASIRIDNSVWGNVFNRRYRELMRQELGAEVWSLQGNTKPINDWIAEKTKGMLSDVVSVSETEEEDLFLVNAVYFNSEWRQSFDVGKTKVKTFWSLDGAKDEVLMMYDRRKIDYYEDKMMQAVRLYYDSGDYMTIFLPRESVDFRKFTANLDERKLAPEFVEAQVNLWLPKFDITYNVLNAKDFYKELGIQKIFSSSYDFAKMISFNEQAQVEKVILQAKITVDEKKTEIMAGIVDASVTGTSIGQQRKLKTFNANRPFVFMINNGDFIGAFVKGKTVTARELEKRAAEKTSEVVVKEQKNGEPLWYEEKDVSGRFGLKGILREK